MIEGNFNTSLSQIDKSFRQELNREILELNKIIVQKDLTDIYKTFCSNTREHIFFSVVYDTLKKKEIKDSIVSEMKGNTLQQTLRKFSES